MARLTVSIDNAKEILGKGLIDSVMILTDSANIEELQTKIENFANSASEGMKKLAGFIKENSTEIKIFLAIMTATFVSTKVIAGIAATVTAIGTIKKAFTALRASAIATAIASMFAMNPYGAAAQVALMLALIAGTIKAVDALTKSYDNANAAKNKLYDPDATGLNHLRELESRYNKSALKDEKKLTAEELKQLNAKKLQLAIDKAKIALGKGDDVFDINKIQLAAAELNQAQLLGKVTSQAQLLQITNDLARLQVKQSILDLEAAIAAKDIKAIEAGTAKLNGDLKILGALTNQELKLRDIESILKDIVPKDLINLANLDAALAKLRLLGSGIITPMGSPTPTGTSTPTLLESLAAGSFAPVVGGGYSSTAGNYASSGFPGSDRGYGSSGGNTIVVNTGIGDPNAIAEAIDQVLRDATDRGTLRVAV
jgi:glycosyltransferase involved in cell wall biosynthesis